MKLKAKRIIVSEGERIEELVREGKFSLALAEIRESKLHVHRRLTEFYLVFDGEGVLFLGDKRIGLRKGDVIRIPPNVPHKVVGRVKIFVISVPPWKSEDHILLE